MELFYGPLPKSMRSRFLHFDSWDPTQGSPRASAVPTHTCPSGQCPHMFPFFKATPIPLGVCFVWLLMMLITSGTSWTKQFHSLVFLVEEMSWDNTLPQRQTKEKAILYTGRSCWHWDQPTPSFPPLQCSCFVLLTTLAASYNINWLRQEKGWRRDSQLKLCLQSSFLPPLYFKASRSQHLSPREKCSFWIIIINLILG